MTSHNDTGDPDRCILELHVDDEGEARALRSKIQPLLVGVDPSFHYVRVYTPASLQEERTNASMDDIQRLARTNQSSRAHHIGNGSLCAPTGNASDKLKTPAISVMLFLKETSVVSCAQAQNQLKSPPWKFHHKIELSNARCGQLKVIGRQEFYQSGRKLPLWSVCPIHYGNLHLRFTIFTRNFSSMVDFYRLLVGHEAEFTRENFCLFTVYSRPGFDLQLAIKQSAQLHPAPLSSAFLKFRVPNIRQLEAMIHTPNGMAGTLGRVGNNLWMIQDPDTNCILVEQVNSLERVDSSVTMVTTDAHNGNQRRCQAADPFRRSRALNERLNLVKGYNSECKPSYNNPASRQSRSCPIDDFKPLHQRRERWPLPLYEQNHLTRNNNSTPWSDQSSYDSGRHSWRSSQETGGSSSDQSAQSDDAETSPPSVTCDCHVITAGRCGHCIAQKRTALCPLDRSALLNVSRNSRDTRQGVNDGFKRRDQRPKPWEIEPPELSDVEWDGLLSLADSDDINFR